MEMRLTAEAEFVDRTAAVGIGRHPRFPLNLAFTQAPDCQRSWLPTGRVSDLPGFLQTAIGIATGDGPVWLYRKGGGSWFEGEDAPIGNHIIDRVLEGIGVPREFAGALAFEGQEWRDLYLVISTFFVWGWSVGEDLYIVPASGSCVLMTSHHGEFIAAYPSADRLDEFEAEMDRCGHPARRDPSRSVT
jgi:hypothetical protein